MELMKISMASLKVTGRMKYDCVVSMVNRGLVLLETTTRKSSLIERSYREEIRLQMQHCLSELGDGGP